MQRPSPVALEFVPWHWDIAHRVQGPSSSPAGEPATRFVYLVHIADDGATTILQSLGSLPDVRRNSGLRTAALDALDVPGPGRVRVLFASRALGRSDLELLNRQALGGRDQPPIRTNTGESGTENPGPEPQPEPAPESQA